MLILLFGAVLGQEVNGTEPQVAPVAVTEPVAVPFAVEEAVTEPVAVPFAVDEVLLSGFGTKSVLTHP